MAWKLKPVGEAQKPAPGPERTAVRTRPSRWKLGPDPGKAQSPDPSEVQTRPTPPAERLIRDAAQDCAYCRGEGAIRRSVVCPVCRGKGMVVHLKTPLVECAFCRGHGERPRRSMVTCAACRGRGFLPVVEPVETCLACRGRGYEPSNSNLVCGTCRGAGLVTVRSKQGGRIALGGSERDLAEAILEQGPLGTWGIARELRISHAYAEMLIKSVLRKGAVQPVGGKNYDLVPGVRKALEATQREKAERAEQGKREQLEREYDLVPGVRKALDAAQGEKAERAEQAKREQVEREQEAERKRAREQEAERKRVREQEAERKRARREQKVRRKPTRRRKKTKETIGPWVARPSQ